MKKKIIIGVSALLVVITSIVIYIFVIVSPYRNIDNLKEYLSKEDANYEATIEYSSASEVFYIDTIYDVIKIPSYTTLYNRVSNYKFSEDAVVEYNYADFKTSNGEYVTNELYATFFYEQTKTECVEYSYFLTAATGYSYSKIWSKSVIWDGDITENYSSYQSLYRYIDINKADILSSLNGSFKKVDGIYYQAVNGVRIFDYPTTVELKANKVIITKNYQTATPTVITLSKLKTTKVKSPLPDATNDGFIFDYNEDSDSYNLIDYTGSSKNVEIPETYNDGINGEKVVDTIGKHCFWNNTKMESITLPSSVRTIGRDAFYGCISDLDIITLPSSIKSIWFNVFDNCDSLKNIYSNEIFMERFSDDVEIKYY